MTDAYTRDRVLRFEMATILIEELCLRHVRMWFVEPDSVRLACQPGIVTPTMLARLALSKPELVEILRPKRAN